MNEWFHCNYKRCQAILNSTAWIGSCSHVFCDAHSSAFGGICSLCSSALNTNYGLVETNLNPSEEKKSMILAGFIPTKIINIGGKALEFWKFQLIQDEIYSKSKVHYLQNLQAQEESSYEAITQRFNSCIEEQAQKYEEIQNKMIIYIERTQELEKKIKIKDQQLMNAHMQLENLWKQQPEQDMHPIKCNLNGSSLFRASSNGQRRMHKNHINEVTTVGSKWFRATSEGPRRMRDNHRNEENARCSKENRENPRRLPLQRVTSSQQLPGINLPHSLACKHHIGSHKFSYAFS